jgi:hypothetical protein
MPDPVTVDEQVRDELARRWMGRPMPVVGNPIPEWPIQTKTELIQWLYDLARDVLATTVTIVPSDPPVPPAPTEP